MKLGKSDIYMLIGDEVVKMFVAVVYEKDGGYYLRDGRPVSPYNVGGKIIGFIYEPI